MRPGATRFKAEGKGVEPSTPYGAPDFESPDSTQNSQERQAELFAEQEVTAFEDSESAKCCAAVALPMSSAGREAGSGPREIDPGLQLVNDLWDELSPADKLSLEPILRRLAQRQPS